MLTYTLAFCMALDPEPASKTVSAMINALYAAKSMTGQIDFVQSASGIQATVSTTFQYQSPSLIYIRQVRRSNDPAEALVTSNGTHFSYNFPKEPFQPMNKDRLIETVAQQGKMLTYRDIYVASSAGLLDRCVPLDLAIGRIEDLKYARNQWASMDWIQSTPDANGLREIGGQYRQYGDAPVSGKYEIWVDKDNNLRRYVVREVYAFAGQSMGEVVSTWNAKLNIDAKPDANLFKLVK